LEKSPQVQGPSDIVFSNNGGRAWVSNETAGTVSLLDAERRHKIRDISVGRVPQGMALTGHKDQLLVTNFGSNTVSVIDTVSAREVGRIAVCQGPIDVATSFQHGLGQDGPELGYVSCFKDGSVAILDINRRQEIQRIAVGHQPFGVAAHPDGGRIYVCVGGSNQLLVLQAGTPSRIIRCMRLNGNPLRLTVTP
jgi:YVTN family beta-propeller protein